MPSNINDQVPLAASQMRAEPLRENFQAAKAEISTLQTQVGTAQTAANGAQTTANTASTTANGALQRGGGTMTGDLTLPAQSMAPVPGANQAITRGYLDLRINEAASAGGMVPEAPSDAGAMFVRGDAGWKDIAPHTTESSQNVAPAGLQAAIDGLPKLLNHDVTFNLSAGSFAGPITIERFTGVGRLQILGPDTIGVKTHTVQQIIVRNCDLREIYIRGIATTIVNATKFSVSNCNSFVVFRRCTADTGVFNNSNNIGYIATNTGAGLVFYDQCTATNQVYGFLGGATSVLQVTDARGTGNMYAFATMPTSVVYVYQEWSISTQYPYDSYKFSNQGGVFLPDRTPRLQLYQDSEYQVARAYDPGGYRVGFSGSIWPHLTAGYDVPVHNWYENSAKTPAFFATGVCISAGRTGSSWGVDPDAPRWNWVAGPEWWEQSQQSQQRATAGKSLFLYPCGGTLEGAPGHNPQKTGDPGWIFKIGDYGCIETAQGFTRCFYVDADVYKPGGGAWGTYSDVRLKTNVAEYKAGLAECLKLTPTTFRYNGRGGLRESAKTEVGLSAQDVKSVMPEMVGSIKGKIDYDDEKDTDILTVDQSPLVFALLNAVKELTGRLAAVETKLDTKNTKNGADD